MEFQINNNQVTSLTFPNRKARNLGEKRFGTSHSKKVYLEAKSTSIDGETGEIVIQGQAPEYVIQSIRSKNVSIDGTYYPTGTMPQELEYALDLVELSQTSGRGYQGMTALELIELGLVDQLPF